MSTNESDFIYIPPFHKNDPASIRNMLDISQNTGVAPLEVGQPLNSEIAVRLHKFLLTNPETYPVNDIRKGKYSIPLSSERHWKNKLLKEFSKIEVNQIEQELERYFNQIIETLFKVDGKAIEVSDFRFKIEKNWTPEKHRHLIGHTWVSATHAIIGPGTWFETIHNGELRKAAAKTGETVVFSELSRNYKLFRETTCSRCSEQHPTDMRGPLHGAPAIIPGKRLILIVFFELVQSP